MLGKKITTPTSIICAAVEKGTFERFVGELHRPSNLEPRPAQGRACRNDRHHASPSGLMAVH